MGSRLGDKVSEGQSSQRLLGSSVVGPNTASGAVVGVVGDKRSEVVGDSGIRRRSRVPRLLNGNTIADEKSVLILLRILVLTKSWIQCQRVASSARGIGCGCFGHLLIGIVGQGPKGVTLR